MMKKCVCCGLPLWLTWLLFAAPWTKRILPYSQAVCCTDLIAFDDGLKLFCESLEEARR